MEIKQEPDDLFIGEQKFEIQEYCSPNETIKHWNTNEDDRELNNFIKKEDGTNPITNHLVQTFINPKSKPNQNINVADIKCNLVHRNDVKPSGKGTSKQRYHIKEWVLAGGILICKLCGNLYKTKFELFQHAVLHLVKKTNQFVKRELCIAKLEDSSSPISDNLASVRVDIEIGDSSRQINDNKSCVGFNSESGSVKCEICLKHLKRKHIKNYMRCHTGEKPFQCEICLKFFSAKSSLVTHARNHNGEKPFKCEICFKFFTFKSGLTTHARIHTGERPFQCKICLESFTVKGGLLRHMVRHSVEKSFKCEVCLKLFSVKSSLVRHMRCHTEEKSFECELCSKSFRERGNLNKHMLCHTGEKPFKCEICLKGFTRNSVLVRHNFFIWNTRYFIALFHFLHCSICSIYMYLLY